MLSGQTAQWTPIKRTPEKVLYVSLQRNIHFFVLLVEKRKSQLFRNFYLLYLVLKLTYLKQGCQK